MTNLNEECLLQFLVRPQAGGRGLARIPLQNRAWSLAANPLNHSGMTPIRPANQLNITKDTFQSDSV
ncbi:MAG: hypothetical protein K2X01_10725 [Cyanobacteria bacterium]|nr:hypothetical protein [Cyanobacteriota bacterium]